MRTFRTLVIYILCVATATAPSLGWSATATKVSARVVAEMASGNYGRAFTLAKYSGLKAADSVTKTVTHTVFSDVFQAAIIMYVAAAAQLAKDQLEKDKLLAGQELPFETVKAATTAAAESLFCGAKPANPNISSEVLCSGEFWVGVGGSWVSRVGAELFVVQALKFLMKAAPTRAALIGTVASMAASFLTLGGFVMSSQLWTDSVTLLNNPEKEAKAHNLFGRAVKEYVSGGWSNWVSCSEDGKLASEVFNNMKLILKNDGDLRSRWLYNGWRFGFARGELIVSLTILMTAISVGTSGGSGLAISAGAAPEGWIAFLAGALVSTLLAGGVSYLTVQFPDLEIGQRLTNFIQSARSFTNSLDQMRVRQSLRYSMDTAFGLDNGWNERNQSLREVWYQHVETSMPRLRYFRQMAINPTLEKYFELRQKLDKAQAILIVAKEVIKNSKMRSLIVYDEVGTTMSYEQARRAYCPKAGRGISTDCDFPLSVQLKKISSAEKLLAESDVALSDLAEGILNAYNEDVKLLESSHDNSNWQVSEKMALEVDAELNVAATSQQIFELIFGSLHESIRKNRNIVFQRPELQSAIANAAPGLIAKTYVNGVDEALLVQQYMKVAAQKPATAEAR